MERKGMRVIYFMGIKPKLQDGERQTPTRCSCKASANIVVTVKGGEPVKAECAACHKPYDLIVEAGEFWPIDPRNIIAA